MPLFDAHMNFAYSLVATAPSPASSGTTLTVATGDGAKFPAAPFNCTVWPPGVQPSTANAEIIRVTSKGGGDNWTIVRAQETGTGGPAAIAIAIGYQIALAPTVKTFTDIETVVTPNIITSTQTGNIDDWNIGLVSGALNVIRMNNAGDATLRGLLATGMVSGTEVIFVTINTGNLFLTHQSGTSQLANRLTNVLTSGNTPVSGGGYARYMYDAVTQTWRLLAHEQGSPIAYAIALTFGGASTGMTSTTNTAYYRVNGLEVFLHGRVTLTAKGSSTGAAAISLPFPVSSKGSGVTQTEYGVMLFPFYANMVGLSAGLISHLVPGSSLALLNGPSATNTVSATEGNFTNTSDFVFSSFYRTQ